MSAVRPLLVCSIALAAACSTSGMSSSGRSGSMTPNGPTASALMRNPSGTVLGRLTIAQSGGALLVSGTLAGLPAGTHGIHIHAVGRCDAPGFATAGGHWNPAMHQHGFDNPQGAHAGDMRNLVADDAGRADVSTSATGGTLDGLLDADGSAIVIHATVDDYRTDPSGNSGARIACGVVTR
jgi:Cu-Zn family superoxide dismutase